MAHVDVEDQRGPRTVQLSTDSVVIGVAKHCAVMLKDADASAEHCELRRGPEGWRVVDLESRNGTRLNDRYVNQNALADGDVLQVGGARLVFHAGAATAVVPMVAPGRRSGRERDREPTQYDEEDRKERRSRRGRKSTTTGATVALMAIPTLLIIAFLGFKLLETEQSINRTKSIQMMAARDRMDWAAVVQAAEGADPSDKYEYERIQKLLAEAHVGLKADKSRGRLKKCEKAWQAVQVWRQTHREANDEFVGQIDDFLGEYGDLGGAPVLEARKHRIAITGKAQSGEARNAKDGWRRLQDALKLMEADGRFGAALTAADEYLEKWGGQRSGSRGDVRRLKEELEVRAGHWFGRQVSVAQRKAEQGSLFQARRVLQKAAAKIGIPKYESRAADELRKIQEAHDKGE